MSASLADVTWPEAEGWRADDSLLAVPLGATEQHGPHLPMSTDTEVARALAQWLAGALPGVVVAPPLAYGASGEHEDFPGTLSIGREAVELVLVELGRSAGATFRRLVLVSAHGGNAEPVARAAERLRAEGRAVLAWSPRFGGDAHAGRVETSLVLALRPDLVRAHGDVAGNTRPLDDLWPALRAHGVRAVSESGVLGDPAGACAAEGRRLLAAAGDELVASVRGWVVDGTAR